MPEMKNKCLVIVFTLLLIFGLAVIPSRAQSSDFSEAKVSITFDDSVASTYNNALPVLSQRDLKATVFVNTGFVGRSGYMTWPQVQALQNQYGWEIGSHTVTHSDLTKLSATKLKNEINNSLAALTGKGLVVSSFATPYGSYNNKVLIEALKTYNLHRTFEDIGGLNSFPYNRAVLSVRSVDAGYTPQDVFSWIDQAIAEEKWLILVLHEVKPSPDPQYEYTTTISDLTQIADYIKNSGIEVVLPNHTLLKPGQNLFTNSTFSKGIADGWTTDNATYVKQDISSNGSYPSSGESIKFIGSATASHLFSNSILNNADSTYAFQAFVNTNALTSGSLNFYLDEYDADNNWISGKNLGWVNLKRVTYFSILFNPTSTAVSSFKIQTSVGKGAKGTAYVDNYEIYSAQPIPTPTILPTITPTITPVPTLTPTPTVTPAVINLVQNGSFEELTQGWANNWQKDSSSFSVDTNFNGNDGPNSLHLTPNTTSAHAFSSRINVGYGNNYIWKQYLKTVNAGGEFGFYVDEYDTDGNWISGQWKDAIYSAFNGIKQISYSPTSNRVISIGLQYYTTDNSTFDLYTDSVSFTK